MPSAIKWTPQLESSICGDIESGLTLRQVAKKHGISKALILKKVSLLESFRDRYARAMEIRTDSDCDGILDELRQTPQMAEHGVDSGWVQWQRVRIDTLKWLLSKRNPKKYGDKITHAGDENSPLALVVKHIGSDGE